jgi:hypothetical protein
MSPDCLPGGSFQTFRSLICRYHATDGVYHRHITRLMREKMFPGNNLTLEEWPQGLFGLVKFILPNLV